MHGYTQSEFNTFIFKKVLPCIMGHGSVVGTATLYGLYGLGFEPSWG
jgi:hypothetical protein